MTMGRGFMMRRLGGGMWRIPQAGADLQTQAGADLQSVP